MPKIAKLLAKFSRCFGKDPGQEAKANAQPKSKEKSRTKFTPNPSRTPISHKQYKDQEDQKDQKDFKIDQTEKNRIEALENLVEPICELAKNNLQKATITFDVIATKIKDKFYKCYEEDQEILAKLIDPEFVRHALEALNINSLLKMYHFYEKTREIDPEQFTEFIKNTQLFANQDKVQETRSATISCQLM